MSEIKLGAVESRFADIIWENEPVHSSTLVKLAENELSWKKSTTYTMLKRLIERGLFENNGGTVTSRVSREEFYAMRSERFVADTFGGSLPAFLAAFTARRPLNREDVELLRRMVAEYGEK